VIEDPEYVPLDYLAELDYNILVMPVDENNLVYIITDISNETKKLNI
jgi:hypothetical protein